MELVEKNYKGYDFYIRMPHGDRIGLYNIVPSGGKPPEGGFQSMAYIERVKGVKFPDRYRKQFCKKDSLC